MRVTLIAGANTRRLLFARAVLVLGHGAPIKDELLSMISIVMESQKEGRLFLRFLAEQLFQRKYPGCCH